MRPPSTETPLAFTLPVFARTPKAPALPAAAAAERFRSAPSGAVILTRTAGVPASTSSTDRPAASTISPAAEVMSPLFSMFGAIRYTAPPLPRIVPWLAMRPSVGPPAKRNRPLMKSASERFSVDATKPAVSMVAPAPTRMPFGLMRNTRPLDSNCPRICEEVPPVTRLSTALEAPDCRKRVISLAPIEKPCQWMIAPGVLVMLSVLPWVEKLAVPAATPGPVGLA